MSALVSIIVPCYNSSAYISTCLDSVVKQTYPNWECIIIDDGSTDDTRDLIKPYLEDSRFIYIYQPNSGLSAARNKALQHAKGNYVQLLDSDDFLYDQKLSIQLESVQKYNGKAISICDFTYSNDSKKKFNQFLTGNYLREFILRVSIPPVCFLFSRNCFDQLTYNTELHTHEDWELMIRLLQQKPVIVICNQILACYRIHPASMTNTRNMKQGLDRVIRLRMPDFKKYSPEYSLMKIRKRLNYWHHSTYKFPQSLLHSLLLKYAVWRYL
ncbi:MAG: glycosyltransferase [Bacteroidia bacterium]|nr:glycosyltransferase [Bacteroidia bacterium]